VVWFFLWQLKFYFLVADASPYAADADTAPCVAGPGSKVLVAVVTMSSEHQVVTNDVAADATSVDHLLGARGLTDMLNRARSGPGCGLLRPAWRLACWEG
jgi:hypothetical protein